jgi:hypothetical protein
MIRTHLDVGQLDRKQILEVTEIQLSVWYVMTNNIHVYGYVF